MDDNSRELNNLSSYLKLIGVRDLPPLTSPFDPGYDRSPSRVTWNRALI